MKQTVAIIFGGKSAEHEISLNSASNIYNAVDQDQFEVVLLGNDKRGNWHFNTGYVAGKVDLVQNDYFTQAEPVYLDQVDGTAVIMAKGEHKVLAKFDVAFSIIHGTYGEDGTLQGVFRALDIPFVGPGVLGSAICMDKDVAKRLLRDGGIPIADFLTFYHFEREAVSFELVKERLGLPLFVKPCNAGSSVGVSKAVDESSFMRAIEEAFRYDGKILVEEAIPGKEVECAVLGNEYPKASVIGEIVPTKDFYSYEAKYQDAEGAKMQIPAGIDDAVAVQLQEMAVRAFRLTGCEGMARVDFFLKEDNTFVLNEINTLPGFTEISMYPKLWAATGLEYAGLITALIGLAVQRRERDASLQSVK